MILEERKTVRPVCPRLGWARGTGGWVGGCVVGRGVRWKSHFLKKVSPDSKSRLGPLLFSHRALLLSIQASP